MKKLLYSIFIGLAALTAGGCDDDSQTTNFAVSTAEWSFDATEGMQRMIISAPDAWTITGVPDWLTVTPPEAAGSREITIVRTANPGTDLREATLIVTCNAETLSIGITQAGKAANPTPGQS